MIEIDLDALAGVNGGERSTQTVTTPLAAVTQSDTNYKRCVDEVVRQTAVQYPSTKPWWNPFATDTNEVPRAVATMDNMRATCGLPPP